MYFIFVFFFFVFWFFWLRHALAGSLVPRPGIEPVLPTAEMQSPNHWTAREVPGMYFKNKNGGRNLLQFFLFKKMAYVNYTSNKKRKKTV